MWGGVNGEEIKWRESIDPGPFEKTFHSPLVKKKVHLPAIIFQPHILIIIVLNVAQVETDGNPSDILDLIKRFS